MSKEEFSEWVARKGGHITETGKCCFCGKEYTDYGYSTWCVWTAEEENEAFGENKRCCAECNEKIVNEARRERVAAVKQGKIENILQDFSEVIYERRSKGLVEGGESIIRVYDNGLYRKILLPREKYKGKKCKGERKDIVYGKELSVVPKLLEFYRENQEEIDSLPDRLKDPYDDRIYSEESIRFGKKLITGPHIFGAPPNEYYDEILEVKRTPEKDAVVQQIRKLWKLAQKIENGILEDEFPLYKKEKDDRRKRIARSLELSRKKYVESRHAHA